MYQHEDYHPTQQYLFDEYEYDKTSGTLYRRQVNGRMRAVGTRNSSRLTVVVGKFTHALHKLIWMRETGRWPKYGWPHHVDGNKFNNRWDNLRGPPDVAGIYQQGDRLIEEKGT